MVIAPEKVREKVKKSVVQILNTELKFFLSEYTIVKDLDGWSEHGDNEKALNKMQGYLVKLKRYEIRQQMTSSVRKLKKLADRLINVQDMGIDVKQEIVELCGELYVFEVQLLFDTAKRLEPYIKGKDNASQVDWTEVRKITDKILQDLRVLITLDKNLDKLIERGF